MRRVMIAAVAVAVALVTSPVPAVAANRAAPIITVAASRAAPIITVAASRAAPVITVAPEVTAGTAVPVTVTGAADGATVTLTVIGSVGSVVLTATASGGAATFVLPGEITRGSGSFTLLAEVEDAQAAGSFEVLPGPAVGPVQPIVGARSIVADGTDRSMVVAIPVDAHGNSIADGSVVAVSHRDPSGEISTAPTSMAHLLAWLELGSGTVAGRGNVWLDVGAVTGQQVSLDEVAAAPVPFTLVAVDPGLPGRLGADGQTLVEVRTSVLTDPFGNVEPDGTLVTVEWDAPDGRARTSALTISGVAELSIQAPVRPATLSITGLCRGTATAAALPLTFPQIVETVPISTGTSDYGLAVTVGPVIRQGGTFVPDGTVATVTLADDAGRSVSGSGGLVDGQLTLVLPVSALTGTVHVGAEVLGATGRTDVG